MKKIIFIILSAIFLIACSSPEKNAQKLIKNSLMESMNDPKSYESVKFSELDSVFTVYYEDPVYVSLNNKIDNIDIVFKATDEARRSLLQINPFDKKIDVYMEELKIMSDSIKSHSNELLEFLDNFTPEFNGWFMTHTFRGNNAMGAKVLNSYRFIFDKDITEIRDVQTID